MANRILNSRIKCWPAPAKLNLFLHITGRRADGYHELQTVFQFLSIGDSLQFEITDKPDIQLLTPVEGVQNNDNLVVKAAKLLQQQAKIKQGAQISLAKKLPMGGGLGGGSSNAATTLVALNHLWQADLSRDELAELGLALGADVPVFVYGHAAWAEGIGEKLSLINPPERWYVVISPPSAVSTTDVFADADLTRDCPRITMSRFLSGEGGNVFEAIVRKHYPAVDEALTWLAQFGEARMTGTGACVFAGFEDQVKAEQVFAAKPSGWQGFVAKGCNRSDLYLSLDCDKNKSAE